MDSLSASLVGMGLAAAGFAGTGVGLGYIFGKAIESFSRQPSAESSLSKYVWIGAAFVEAVALYGLVVAFIIMGKGG
ncbi:MAG: ATP synthase F0 subunit C [Magnetococcales bacterium]|nr:ATP synthase F0 subunit C [Magnetococcales bacterium]